MGDDNRSMLDRVEQYRQLVLRYEALDEVIDDFLMAHGGTMEKMSPEDLSRYRDLARQRDDLQNEMRVLERELSLDEENGN